MGCFFMGKLVSPAPSTSKESKQGFSFGTLLRALFDKETDISDAFSSRKYTFGSQALATPTPSATEKPQPTKMPTQANPSPSGGQVRGVSSTNSIAGRTNKFRSALNENTQPNVNTIVRAANQIGVNPGLLLDIAAQESMLGSIERTEGYHPTERSASGLFQFTAPTWVEGVNRYGKDLGLDRISAPTYSSEWVNQIDQGRMDKMMNALMAAKFIKDGMLSRWNASKDVWGPHYSQDEINY